MTEWKDQPRTEKRNHPVLEIDVQAVGMKERKETRNNCQFQGQWYVKL